MKRPQILNTRAVAVFNGLEALALAVLTLLVTFDVIHESDVPVWMGVVTAVIAVLTPILQSMVWSQDSVDKLTAELEASDPDEGPPPEWVNGG